MTPSTSHRLLSLPMNTRLYLDWPQPRISFRRRVYTLLFGGETPVDLTVDPAEFRAAFRLLDSDPQASAAAFRALGYDVVLSPHQ